MAENSMAFQHDIGRLVVREKIAEMLSAGVTSGEISKKIRTLNLDSTVESVVDKLSRGEFFVDDKTKGLVNYLQGKVKENFPNFQGLSFVILGSSSNGGKVVRDLLGTGDDVDLDLGMLYNKDSNISKKDLIELSKYVENEVITNSGQFGFSEDYSLCIRTNPQKINSINLENVEEANKIFDLFYEKKGFDPQLVLIYFYPSIPEEVNISNQKIILDCLTRIYESDKDKWNYICDELVKSWVKQRRFKARHLAGKYTDSIYNIAGYSEENPKSKNTKRLILKAIDDGQEMMISVLKKKLEATAINKD